MHISQKHRMAFIHVHRTGGTTLTNLLREEMGKRLKTLSQHGDAQTDEIEWLDRHPDWFVFGFVRNPWARLASWYTFHLHRQANPAPDLQKDFEAFLNQVAHDTSGTFHLNQIDYFTDKSGHIRTQFIGRFENYEADVRTVFQTLELEVFDIPKLNARLASYDPHLYTDKSREWVTQWCARDIAHFDYKFSA